MPKYKIQATYLYDGIVEAEDEGQAETVFLASLNRYYTSTEEYECEQLCEECEGEYDLDDNGVCEDCREEGDN